MSSETTETSRGLEFLAWLEANKTRLIVSAAVIAVVASTVGIYRWRKGERELQASTVLLKAQRADERNDTDEPASAEPFLRVANDFRGTSAAGRATLLAGEALFTEGKYTEATQQFESFLRDHSASSFAPTAALGVAACLDAQEKANEAMAAYQALITTYPGSAAANQAKLALAGLHESRNEFAQAVKLYGELSAPGQQSAWGMEAGMRRESLLRQHPELAPTNPPMAALPTVTMPNTDLVSPTNTPAAPAPAP